MSSKKGQVYVFVAILLIVFAFSVTRPSTAAASTADSFKELYENFVRESPVLVNGALHDSRNVSASFVSFADSYFTYARGKSSRFRFLYILHDNDVLLIGNKLGLSVNASFSSYSYNVSDGAVLTTVPADVIIDVEGVRYSFDITSEPYEVKAIFRQQTDKEKRVFISK